MNEEIKEILNGLSKKASIYKMQINKGTSFNTNEYEANELLNYITNLQEENQKLNKIIDELEKWLKEDKEKSAITFEMGKCFNMFDILNKLTELKNR